MVRPATLYEAITCMLVPSVLGRLFTRSTHCPSHNEIRVENFSSIYPVSRDLRSSVIPFAAVACFPVIVAQLCRFFQLLP